MEGVQFNPAVDAANQLFRFVDHIQKSEERSALPKGTLHIGPKREKNRSLGHRLVSATSEHPHYLEGSSRGVFEQITKKQTETVAAFRDIGLIVMAFFLHNYTDVKDQQEFLKGITTAFPDAILIAADYTLKNITAAEIERLATSEFEKTVLKQRGADQFIEHHNLFDLHSLEEAIGKQYRHVLAETLAPGRGIAIGREPLTKIQKRVLPAALEFAGS